MRLPKLCAMVLVAVSSGAQAQERFTPPFGGTGGTQFITRCPAGTELTGVAALAGAYVNGIAPICDGRQGRMAGGGGDRRSAECPQGSVVEVVHMVSLRSDNHLLKMLAVHCVSKRSRVPTAAVRLDTPGRYTRPFNPLGSTPGYPATDQSCGRQSIVGLQGRAGASIDALGLICR